VDQDKAAFTIEDVARELLAIKVSVAGQVQEVVQNLKSGTEASIWHWVDGCATTPVGYLEGWCVDPDVQRQGIGRALVKSAEG
jgi:aminoglycoside 6'-N-acetyltransferase I